MRVSVAPDPAHPAGHALIRIDGAAPTSAGLVFSISRPDWAECNLGPGGWQIAEASLTPDAVTADGGALILAVGPAVCDHLESGVYVVAVAALGLEASVQWPEIVPEYGGRSTYFAQSRKVASAGVSRVARTVTAKPLDETIAMNVQTNPGKDEAWVGDSVVRTEITPKPEPIPPRTDPVAKIVPPPPSRGWIWIVLVVFLAACAAGGVYAYLYWPLTAVVPPVKPNPPKPDTPVIPPIQPPRDPTVDLDHMSVVDLAKRNKPAEMVDQAKKRLAAKPGESMLLLEAAGDDLHDGAALTLLAQLYDPNKPRQGGIPADARQAARYYRDAAAHGDTGGAADRAALHATITQRKDAGDISAKLIEQDFWP